VIEVASDSTRRRDRVAKRGFYQDLGIPEYWIVDGESRTITIARAKVPDVVLAERLVWQPAGASGPFALDVAELFRAAGLTG
jgi:Uma2 family endonuclease